MLHVVAIITTKPGKRDEVLAIFKENLPAVLAEKGCIEYVPVIDVDGGPDHLTRIGPDSFMVIEKWECEVTLMAHAASPHMAAYAARVKDLVVSRAIHVLAPV
ncbi:MULTISPECIES: putative quinol monooxygenase [Rhodomicrobium]|uniref:putative quinol monooxygenase n=1 Tax=Rhodomicrobium TaxID=1068 RepID=UPI000B4BF1A1|nr:MULTISPECIES: putative quinol monooxygenase [Rhodomicrobium]